MNAVRYFFSYALTRIFALVEHMRRLASPFFPPADRAPDDSAIRVEDICDASCRP